MTYVSFHLAPRYFQSSHQGNGMTRDACISVMKKSFHNLDYATISSHMNQHQNGFEIICTPQQFTAFIIFRHEIGRCINGIRDLMPKFISQKPDPMAEIKRDLVDRTGVREHHVSAVLAALESWSYSGGADIRNPSILDLTDLS